MRTPGDDLALLSGVALGAIHGTILWGSIKTLGIVSYFAYGDTYALPFEVTLIVDFCALCVVLTSGWWLPRMMNLQEAFVEEIRK